MNIIRVFLLGMLIIPPILTRAMAPVPLADINTSGGGSMAVVPGDPVVFNGYLYFAGQTPDLGAELFRVPVGGTTVELVKDLNPGPTSSWPQQLTVAGNTLFFFANGYLWKSDGTETGTRSVRRLSNAQNVQPAAMGNQLYFAASDSSGKGTELWKSDGTYDGTSQWDINAGSGSSYPKDLTVSGNLLYFSANGHLWKCDGTAVTNISSSIKASGVYPQDISTFDEANSSVAFWGWDASSQVNVWVTDGSTTTSLNATPALRGIWDLNVTNKVIFFAKNTQDNSTPRLYISDGTPAGTAILDINPGTPTDVVGYFVPSGPLMYYRATTTATGGEWWVTDTTDMSSTLLEVTPGVTGTSIGRYKGNPAGQLFFSADDGSTGVEPWISNGTAAGTHRIKDILPGPGDGWVPGGTQPVVFSNGFFFQNEYELWRSDGTDGGTLAVTENLDFATPGSGPGSMVASGGAAFFCATDEMGRELWRTDGTAAGTYRVHDLRPGSGSGCTGNWVATAGGYLYFQGTDGSNTGLWKSDGVSASPQFIRAFSSIGQVVSIGAVLYFRADGNDGAGTELWSSTASTATRVKDIYPGSASSGISYMKVLNNKLVFSAQDPVNGGELWTSDGTEAGTQILRNIAADVVGDPVQSSSPSELTVIGNRLYFSADNKTDGREPWISDGTSAGTTLVDDIGAGSLGSNPREFTSFAGKVYFTANENGGRGDELFRTDGTGAGTFIIDIVPGSGSSYPRYLTVAGSYLYFSAEDTNNGMELWKTDGATASLVKDINTIPGEGSSPSSLFPAGSGNQLYFSPYLNNDNELWVSDGTSAGTHLLADINPADRSDPGAFFNLSGQILFQATTQDTGRELWTFGEVDCGDAPDPQYPTLLASGGACHGYDAAATLFLGSSRDADTDGQPSAGADGDDNNGNDDEDGVVFTPDWVIGQMASLDVTLADAGVLNLWVDWQNDGDWADFSDRAVYNLRLDAGTHTLSVLVPDSNGVNAGTVNARVRLTSGGISSPMGIYADGEVEDYQLTLVDHLDYGDAPASYPTLKADDGAAHRLVSGMYLGAGVDTENDGLPSVNADGDDNDGTDDEDGITFNNALVPGGTGDIDALVSMDGYLSAWIDFNQDGDWDDSGENIIDDWVSSGSNNLTFQVPGGALNGYTYARFRFYDNGNGYLPTGFSRDGEVEDYRVLVGGNPPVADAGIDRVVSPETEPVVLGGQPAASDGTPPYTYAWAISPGTPGQDFDLDDAAAANPVFTGYSEMTFTATLTVTDAQNMSDVDSAVIDVAFPDDRNITLPTLTGAHSYEACQSISTGSVTVVDGADITLIAPVVSFGPGFRVEANAILRVITAVPVRCEP